jgi:hypothetical protein
MLDLFEKPARDAKYLVFIRQQSCCLCLRHEGIQAHHVGNAGMGQKTSDYNTVPLCLSCHGFVHNPPRLVETNKLKGFLLNKVDEFNSLWKAKNKDL